MKASLITKQASYVSNRHMMSNRLNKFNKEMHTSPRFYENEAEKNSWIAKIGLLKKGKISQIFNNNRRIESLQDMASNVRSSSLISATSV